jgi:carbonic anhydrase/acetyltransferase-like protein (isoleucine patch superfamily)
MEAWQLGAAEISGRTMKSVISFNGITPSLHASVFLAEGSRIVGDVAIGEESSVWFNAVVRGDVHWVRIGRRSNVQDGAMLHVTHNRFPLTIGDEVTIGHAAVLHGCTIEDRCLIGMGAIVLDGAQVRRGSMIAAGALVREGFEVPVGMLVAGVPAKVKRPLTSEESAYLAQSAENYVRYVSMYRS